MDFNDMQKATTLAAEKQIIQRALETFDAGGRIVAVIIGHQPAPGEPQRPPMMMGSPVPTAYIDYPPQMVDAIKAAFNSRLTVITEELSKLGITGI